MSGFDWDLGQENSNLAWYRKYRPRNLDDYAGESVCQKVRAVMRPENRSHLPHFWFIYGTHGCGKTTLARILAKYYLCQNPDENGEPCGQCEACRQIEESLISEGKDKDVEGVKEVNASEENGKEGLLKAFSDASQVTFSKYNILILDEIQKASEAAQQALLKPLEDIGDNFVVIMATTEPAKVLATIRSRAQITLQIGRHKPEDIVKRLAIACEDEHLSFDKAALESIALREKGVFRESFNRLENIVMTLPKGQTKITKALVDESYNQLPDDFFVTFLKNVRLCNLGALVLMQSEIITDGYTPLDFVSALSGFFAEGLECVYGKMSAGKKTKEFMMTLSDTQALMVIQTLGECRERLKNAGKYDEGLSILEIAAMLYSKVFAESQTTMPVTPAQINPVAQAKAGTTQLEDGEEEFRQKLLSQGKGDITEDTPDEEDTF